MSESTVERRLSFTLKDMIYIVAILVSVLGNYYSTDTRLILVEKDVAVIKAEIKAYKGLPAKVDNIEQIVNKSAKTTEIIYLGLISNGTLKPPGTN